MINVHFHSFIFAIFYYKRYIHKECTPSNSMLYLITILIIVQINFFTMELCKVETITKLIIYLT
jgi:hypothetical protein